MIEEKAELFSQGHSIACKRRMAWRFVPCRHGEVDSKGMGLLRRLANGLVETPGNLSDERHSVGRIELVIF